MADTTGIIVTGGAVIDTFEAPTKRKARRLAEDRVAAAKNVDPSPGASYVLLGEKIPLELKPAMVGLGSPSKDATTETNNTETGKGLPL